MLEAVVGQVRERIEGRSKQALDRLTPRLAAIALQAMSWSLRWHPGLKGQLEGVHPQTGIPYEFRAQFQFRTRDGGSQAWARFGGGRMRAGTGPLPEGGANGTPQVCVVFRDEHYMRQFFSPSSSPDDLMTWMLEQHLTFEGNLTALSKFGHLATAVAQGGEAREREGRWPSDGVGDWWAMPVRGAGDPCPVPSAQAGAPLLPDPALSCWTLDDFPHLKRQLHAHHHTRPRICTERARLWTEAALIERQRGATGENSALRQARIFAHVMHNKRAIVRDDDLLLGTTTSHRVGVIIFPELGGTVIWPELLTVEARELNPYVISEEEIRVLDQEVFPFWIDDNVREWARRQFDAPRGMRLDERLVLTFLWKNHAISHTVVDVPTMLERGLAVLAAEARQRAGRQDPESPRQQQFHEGTALCLEGVIDYALRLADEADRRARVTWDKVRRRELQEMAAACRQAPVGPARTVREALNAVWVCFLALHQENMNAGLSIGRMDRWLQPFFESEMERATGPAQREAVIRRTLELVGAFLLKGTDHLPLVADLGNRLFGGSSSDQVITLGGEHPDGSSAVSDMTYIFLKATEMLALRDPNMNARVSPGVNPDYYLRRLCEVNLITVATPSLHNDAAVHKSLTRLGYPPEDARDWSATGCVEPTMCGRHMGHTNCMMFNLVAPLEMALHDGEHPVMGERVGPRSGDPRRLEDYRQLLAAYKTQLKAVIESAVEANNLLGRAHRELHPTPYLSSLIQGTAESACDVTEGGARYNSSGIAFVGLADVVDSLTAINTLVYQRSRCSMDQLLQALSDDFHGHESLRAEIIGRVPRFGGEDPFPGEVATDLCAFIYDLLEGLEHYRGGRYTPGYWSMSNHVAFGLLSGALPSGRRRGKPFTPGITPSPLAGNSLLDHIRGVARLDPEVMPNNMAFNVKLAPGGEDTRAQVVDRMTAYARSYFELGGMQLQFNVVSSQTMQEAMENPEDHRDLLVRISGYNAYFVTLNRDMQLELIERAEHR